ncbi:LAETG motif-containing sortase-dependent surface protein [Streptomyces sp. MA25(2023)]|uniref:LAETG motif-containing sortase-dependent surface protein n=1 Tax=Streptomyces sp. MA25(2023) TaxID=3055078 RepID=UPI0025AFAFC6|nr:LAETG motif-containing sortase-dependent surface protein [Streptomyces sp. MA25(2023)]MDN3252319.1 LAETG motif-containing sortase-dependent surface protein [Streptomyces sp. MA25(2023)]
MKLRRAIVTMAATSVIAPLALLSAPAAFATESPSPAASETSGTGTTAPDDQASPTDGETSPTDGQSTPSDAESTPTDEESTPTDAPSTPTDGESTPGSGTTEPAPSPSTSAPTDEPTEPELPEVPVCEEMDADYAGAKVSADIKGLPGKIVAGDGYHPFELVVTNESKTDVKEVAFYAEVENYEFEDESKFLSSYVDLEFKNPETGAWDRVGDDDWAGDYFFFMEKLKAKATQTVDMRLSVDAKAPAGDAYSFAFGAYLDDIDGQECIAAGWSQYDFQILASGSGNPNPGTAKPSDKGDDKDGKISVKQPQGDVSKLPTGSLAETGSSSALPTIGLVGGLAVVVGAGAVFVVRRRKAGAQA